MIQYYDLFDLNLEPGNICVRDHGDGSMCESHTIQFCVGKRGSHTGSFIESKNELGQESIATRQEDARKSMNESQTQDMPMSQSSPRSVISESTRLRKQTKKLNSMKDEALGQLIGLKMFQLMFFSKCSFSNSLSDADLLEGF